MMNECRHLLSELEKGTKFILVRSGDKYMSMGHNGSKGRIIVKPIVLNVDAGLFKKGNFFILDNVVLLYRTMTNSTYQSAPDWKLKSKWKPIVTECINYLKDIEGERE